MKNLAKVLVSVYDRSEETIDGQVDWNGAIHQYCIPAEDFWDSIVDENGVVEFIQDKEVYGVHKQIVHTISNMDDFASYVGDYEKEVEEMFATGNIEKYLVD